MRQRLSSGRFPAQAVGAFTPWRGAKEVSGVAFVVTQEVPTSSCMAVPHGPAGVGKARHRMREQLSRSGVSESVVDDAVLILSELVSNACRHGRPLGHSEIGDGDIRAEWRVDKAGRLTVEVTDGGGPTRPIPATPSVTARGGRGLNIISALAQEWGVRDSATGEVTVWVIVTEGHRREDFATRVTAPALTGLGDLDDLDGLESLEGMGGLDGLDGLDGFEGLDGLGGLGRIDDLGGLDFADSRDDKD
ncbi:ATP-binding protein [Streptomyces sp. NPDC101062]|uniref:ATP-binding protein n=1 Tax=unclassified Streptomyces TaxID=2593676 RepID=UPI0038000C55